MCRYLLLLLFFCLGSLPQAGAQTSDSSLSASEKIYGLSLFWQETNYNFAYFENVPALNWDSAYQAFIPRVLKAGTRFEYYRELQAFCALLKDGHTNVYLPTDLQAARARRSFGSIRLELRRLDNRPVVVNVANDTYQLIPPGSEILQVNGIPVDQYIDTDVKPFLSQSASYILDDYAVDYLLDGFIGDSVHIQFRKPDGSVEDRGLRREIDPAVSWWRPYQDPVFESGMYGDICYLALNSFSDAAIVDSFRAALPMIRKSAAVVLDLRRNGGGSSSIGAAILSYFTDSTFIKGSRWFTREHRAAYKAWGAYTSRDGSDSSDWARTATAYFRGRQWYSGGQTIIANQAPPEDRMPQKPLAVLMGHQTASAAEDFLIMLDGLQDRAVTFGERSFASTGQPLLFTLPGGGSARICTKKDTYPDGRIFVGTGVQPNVLIPATYADFMSAEDRTLNEALRFLRRE